MPSKILKILKEAQEEKWAVGQFNVSTLETLRGAVLAAQNLKSPLIIGASEGESRFLGLKQIVSLISVFKKETRLPIFLNLDHGKTFEYIKEAIEAGFDMVHFDGSDLPLPKNIEITKKVTEFARKRGVSVEGEVGVIGGELTLAKDAQIFVEQTKADGLAVNVGTFHGQGLKEINLPLLKEIKEKVKDKVFLVLHGGSGVSKKDFQEAIKIGIVKVNINTELRISFLKALKNYLKKNPKELKPYRYLFPAIEAVQKTVENKIRLLGSVNKI